MTVAELIEELQKYPLDVEVLMDANNEYILSINRVTWNVETSGTEWVGLDDYK